MLHQQFLKKLQDPSTLERLVAFTLDASISLALSIIPMVGLYIGMVYFFMKDALPFNRGESFGKHLYQLKLVDRETLQEIDKGRFEKSVIRSLILIIPIINIIDIVYFFKLGHRLADEWTNTLVVKKDTPEE